MVRFCALHGFTAKIRGAMMSLETSEHPRFRTLEGTTFIIFRLEIRRLLLDTELFRLILQRTEFNCLTPWLSTWWWMGGEAVDPPLGGGLRRTSTRLCRRSMVFESVLLKISLTTGAYSGRGIESGCMTRFPLLHCMMQVAPISSLKSRSSYTAISTRHHNQTE